ncbi:hypothetical protein QI155_10920, partial [Thermodesulfovibrio sp. 1176]|uniref:hypothetical protein n=1 Tax=Thermodesulfovibrio sp. 1176 TaxID=3043424 RepID=UPI0024832575
SGDVQLVCPSSKEFLTVLVKPKGTGDFDADIYWDSDMDGKMDRSLTVNNVSGICTNGFISCQPGTWRDCQNYEFKFENSELFLQQSYRTELAGCFCINQSCGSNLLWNNIGYVLKIFGGAVAGAFQKVDSRYAISDARIDGAAIYFYSQKTKDCRIAEGGSGILYPESFWKTPYAINSTVESLVLSQSQDSNSFYNLMVRANQNNYSQLRSCVVKRNIYSDITYRYKPCGEFGYDTFTFIGGYDLNGDSKQCYYYRNSCYMLSGHDSSWNICYSRLIGHGNILYFINSSFLAGTGLTAVEVTNLTHSGMANLVNCFGSGDDAADIWIYVKATCQYLGCQVIENIENSCLDMENNSSCTLYDEFVDGVQTVRGGVRTGLYPLKQCVTLCAGGNCPECGQIRCYDWISRNRTYLCTDQPIDLSSSKTRLGSVVSSSNYSDSTGVITFNDVRYENGIWKNYSNQTFWVGGKKETDSCEKACRVKVASLPTQVGLGDPVSSNRTGSYTGDIYYYRPCYNDICPAQEGETIDIPCQCMNDFGAASTLMQTMRIAGQDMICTSGNIKTLPGY